MNDHTPGQRGDRRTGELLATIVRTMAEMEQGRRSVAALDPVASPLAARRIRRLVRDARMHATTVRRGQRPSTVPVRARTTASFHPSAGVTEGVVVVSTPDRSRAYCVRLEQEGERWRLVELAQPDCSLRPVVTHASRSGAVYVDGDGWRRSSARGVSARTARGDVDRGTTDGRDDEGEAGPVPAVR